MSRDIGLSIAAGLLGALLFLSVAAGVGAGFLLSYAAPLPIMMAGLSLGFPGALIASLVGTGASLLATGTFTAVAFAVAVGIPSLVVARQSLLWRQTDGEGIEWYPPGLVLAWLSGTCVTLLLAIGLLVPSSEQGIEASVRAMLETGIGAVFAELPLEQRLQLLQGWVPLFPGMVGASWLVMAVINALGAQSLLSRLGKNRRPSPDYVGLALPDQMAIGLAVALAVGFAAPGDLGYIGRNVALILAVPFGFQGLGMVHDMVRARPNARMILAAFYVVLVVAFGVVAFAVVGLGLARQWVRLRRRMSGGSGKEE